MSIFKTLRKLTGAKTSLVFGMVLMSCLEGCSRTVYVVELRPEEDGMLRTVRIDTASAEPSDGEQNGERPVLNERDRLRFAEAYPAGATRTDDGEFVFRGHFALKMPGEIGGYGRFVSYRSEIGTAHLYSERFRGKIGLADRLRNRQRKLDEAVDLIRDWMLTDAKDLRRVVLGRWIDSNLRNHLHDLRLYIWTHSAADQRATSTQGDPSVKKGKPESWKADAGQRLAMDLLQYSLEKGYVDVSQIPELIATIDHGEQERTLDFIVALISQKAYVETGEDFLQTFDNPKSDRGWRESLAEFLSTTPQYLVIKQKALRQHGAQNKDGSGFIPPKPLQTLTAPLFEAFMPSHLFACDSVELSLHLSQPPDQTNGVWDSELSCVRWRMSLDQGPMPSLAFAIWSEANEQTQQRVFQDTALTGERLTGHVMWYENLPQDLKQKWDQMLGQVSPNFSLVEAISNTKFEDTSPLQEEAKRWLEMQAAQ